MMVDASISSLPKTLLWRAFKAVFNNGLKGSTSPIKNGTSFKACPLTPRLNYLPLG